jgi:DNA-binding PadR family transcriptional regulator
MKEDDFRMPGFHRHMRFENGRSHRTGGMMELYILHSLTKGPKTGYDLIKEISEKTDGIWVPSKGTLYPMLKKMEEEGLIAVSDTGSRSKNIYEITEEGRDLLERMVKHRKEAGKRIHVFRRMMSDIFGGNFGKAGEALYEIHQVLEEIPPEKEEEAAEITKKCLEDLKRLKPNESGNS